MAGLFDKIKQMWNTPDDEYDYDDREEEKDERESGADDDYYSDDDSFSDPDPVYTPTYMPTYTPPAPTYTPPAPAYTPPAAKPAAASRSVSVDSSKLQVVVFRPDRFSDETRTIADELVKQHTIVLNLEGANKDNSRRIIDFMSGAAYATGGKIKRASTSTFVVIPSGMKLSSDELLAQLESNGVLS